MTDKTTKTGVAAGIAASGDPGEVPGTWTPKQLNLLPSEALGGDLGATVADQQKAVDVRRGRGRPPGSMNKSTREWAEYLNTHYTNPLVGLAETAARPVAQLAKELGCTKVEAFRIQQDARKALAPYTNQAMPKALDLGSEGDVMLTILTQYRPPEASNDPGGQGGMIKIVDAVEVDDKDE